MSVARRRPRRGRVILMVVGSIVALALVAVGSILAIGGIFVPAVYLQPWSKTYYEKFDDPRMQVVAMALLAPSGHNMQPWRVQLAPDSTVLYLYIDSERLSPAVDPLTRQAMVSQGTFLTYLTVAAHQLGYDATVELFPDGSFDELDLAESMVNLPVAKISLAPESRAPSSDFDSLFLSDTNRAPYADTALTAAQIASLDAVARQSSAALRMLTAPSDLDAMGELAVEGTLIESRYAAATAESAAVFSGTEQAKNEKRYGFAVEGQGTSGLMKYLLQGLITLVPSLNDDAASAKNAIALTDAAVTNTPAYALVSTAANTRTDQVEAGMLFAAVSLRARSLGLVVQPLSQVIEEYPAMAKPYADVHRLYAPEGQTIQMIVRVGVAVTDYPVTMRRDASELLIGR